MLKQITLTAATVSLMALGACTTTGNTERGAAIGAGAGAIAGAIIGNNVGDGDAATGAAIGAVVGGAGGAYAGQQKDKNLENRGYNNGVRSGPNGQQLYYDNRTDRYYYFDQASGKTYYENGQLRS